MSTITYTPSQQYAFDQIVNTFNKGLPTIIILKGYAGTGKTTLLAHIVRNLGQRQWEFAVMAPTGRAAKVLRDKVYHRSATIHSQIFSRKLECKEVQNPDTSQKSYKYIFPIISTPTEIRAIIVDESSMISDVETETNFLRFGSGRLLSDLVEFVKVGQIPFVIFTGDDAQLPPVCDSQSYALNEEYFTERGFNVMTLTLTDVVRQTDDSGILQEATKMRDLLVLPRKERKEFAIQDNGNDIHEVPAIELAEKFTTMNPSPNPGDSIVVCYSNRMCYDLNNAVREILFPNNNGVVAGDVMLVNANNYTTFGHDMFNGDFVKVAHVGNEVVHENIPVSFEGEKRHINLTFGEIDLIFPGENIPVSCIYLKNLLDSPERDLSIWEQRALYIDFCMRNKDVKDGSDQFTERIKGDKYFNAVRLKYGYAVTCHKSQGGEWNTVFVDYGGRCGLFDDAIRWCYTATTRAKQQLYIINPPRLTFSSELKFNPIGMLGKQPKDFWAPNADIQSPFHSADIMLPVRLKCLGIMEAVAKIGIELTNVQSFSYQQRYTFKTDTGDVIVIAYYDGNGGFKQLPISGDGSIVDKLNTIVNSAYYAPDFKPESFADAGHEALYQQVAAAAEECGLRITNIIDDLPHYKTTYCFYSPKALSTIEFYIMGNGRLSTAIPKSQIGAADSKLTSLMTKII